MRAFHFTDPTARRTQGTRSNVVFNPVGPLGDANRSSEGLKASEPFVRPPHTPLVRASQKLASDIGKLQYGENRSGSQK
jgi:hypothetical protein